MESIIYLFLALLGLGFLIFIHELGHYVVARRVGMKVEVFSIGFGKPIRTWEIQGVKWQLCYLPFGGFVKIAGMEKKGSLEPHEIAEGFYGKTPWARIKVALAGPVVNFAFALIVFTIIWLAGGQEKPFQQFTNVVGFVDPSSALYEDGLRPGDEITSFDHKPTDGIPKLYMDLFLREKASQIAGKKIDYSSGSETSFTYEMPAQAKSTDALNLGISPASYLIFSDFTSPNSPMQKSGIQKGDRILWVNGSYVFSNQQLATLLNEEKTVLTVQRGSETLLIRVPRMSIASIDFDAQERSELEDWQNEAQISGKISQLYFIPFRLSHEGTVERSLAQDLHEGDRIIAVEGTPTQNTEQILQQLQERKALVIVARDPAPSIPSWKNADNLFISSFHSEDVQKIATTIGTERLQTNSDHAVLLSPVTLKTFEQLTLDPKMRVEVTREYETQKKTIEKMENVQERENQLRLLEESQKRLMLGVTLTSQMVAYNPSPARLFADTFDQTWRTLSNLFTGFVSPKNLTGPVGIVQTLQMSWASGVKTALFWLGFVSLNLAILNLLPIPVLDGGHILFAGIETVTRKPIRARTMEKLIIPFVILMIGLFIYITYNDLSRLLHRFF
ncbi:MAG: RIP metalloprotease RseP [Verrucomicrobia bacterium]|nr:RIP metalloprotease RseP [Verrucomicrobiota bacterium]